MAKPLLLKDTYIYICIFLPSYPSQRSTQWDCTRLIKLGYKWADFGTKERVRELAMDSTGAHMTLTILLGTVLWTGCFAAPTQCHFISQALCEYEGKQYSLGQSWMQTGCLQCTCLHPVGVGCCEIFQLPVDFPAWCKVHLEPETCRVTLVQTADPRLPCVSGELGGLDPSHRTSNMGVVW
ncbi:prostate-associated microseminoprotein isoform X2 [Arapaima gigas]